jgi:hypothetical protein
MCRPRTNCLLTLKIDLFSRLKPTLRAYLGCAEWWHGERILSYTAPPFTSRPPPRSPQQDVAHGDDGHGVLLTKHLGDGAAVGGGWVRRNQYWGEPLLVAKRQQPSSNPRHPRQSPTIACCTADVAVGGRMAPGTASLHGHHAHVSKGSSGLTSPASPASAVDFTTTAWRGSGTEFLRGSRGWGGGNTFCWAVHGVSHRSHE